MHYSGDLGSFLCGSQECWLSCRWLTDGFSLSLILPEFNKDVLPSSCVFLEELQKLKTQSFIKDGSKGFFLHLGISKAQLSFLLQLETYFHIATHHFPSYTLATGILSHCQMLTSITIYFSWSSTSLERSWFQIPLSIAYAIKQFFQIETKIIFVTATICRTTEGRYKVRDLDCREGTTIGLTNRTDRRQLMGGK